MSAEATAWAWQQAEKVGATGLHVVLLALADKAQEGGECYPARRTLAQMTGYSTRTVTRKINELVDLGVMEKDERIDDRREKPKRQTSNRYRLKLDSVAPSESEDPWPGDVKGALTSGVTPPLTSGVNPPLTSGVKPGTTTGTNNNEQKQTVSDDVKIVYDHHLAVFKPPTQPKLGPSLTKQIEKGLREYDAAALCVAIDGLFEWRKRKPGKITLGAIFDTYPGGKPLTEQIAFFIAQAKGSTGVGRNFPSADRAIVAEKQRLVQRGHRLSGSPEAVEQAKDAEQWLREHGIETVRPGRVRLHAAPTFRPLVEKGEGPA